MNSCYDDLTLEFSAERIAVESNEPSRFIHEREGTVKLSEADDVEHTIGTFKTLYVDVEAATDEEESVLDVFDTRAAVLDYYRLYDNELTFTRAVSKATGTDFFFNFNLLILDRLIIEPQFRGQARGLIALRGLIQVLRPGAGLVAMKPFPLQNESHFKEESTREERARLRLDDFPGNQRSATAALCRYYSRLGFKKVRGSEYMVLDPRCRLKSIEELRKVCKNAIVQP